MTASDAPIYISLGAGVQSSTMALMASHGELPGHERVRGAIFADTQAEPMSVYRWLDWLEEHLAFPVYRVTAGSLEREAVRVRRSKPSEKYPEGRDYIRELVPAFLVRNGEAMIQWRRCTAEFKIRPIYKFLRSQGHGPSSHVEVWVGISTDEVSRMKPSREEWVTNAWPLIDAGVSREGCKSWMRARGFPEPPRSACVFCPFHTGMEWEQLRTEEPEEFERAVQFEKQLRAVKDVDARWAGELYLWRGLEPLDEASFMGDPRQGWLGFENECEGMCGV